MSANTSFILNSLNLPFLLHLETGYCWDLSLPSFSINVSESHPFPLPFWQPQRRVGAFPSKPNHPWCFWRQHLCPLLVTCPVKSFFHSFISSSFSFYGYGYHCILLLDVLKYFSSDSTFIMLLFGKSPKSFFPLCAFIWWFHPLPSLLSLTSFPLYRLQPIHHQVY